MFDVSAEHRKIALFGGAYNNWSAVEHVLADARKRGVDGIWFLGDTGGFGPHPNRVADVLREADLGLVQGNYDDSVGNGKEDCACGYTDPRDNHFAQISYDYTLANTHDDHKTWLRSMPTEGRVKLGDKVVHLCHGSPRMVNEFLWESTTPTGFIEHMCRQTESDLIACTHTGIHWERRLDDGRGVVNVGAVGRPANDGRKNVWYGVLEWRDGRIHTEFVPVEYDWERVSQEMRDEGLPEEFVETLTTGWWTTCLEVLPAKERVAGRF